MALQSSGTISLDDIQNEFGGSNPVNISDYYRGGTYVPDTSANSNIPTSGVISLSNFYGATTSTTSPPPEPSDTYVVELVSEIDAQTACSVYTSGNTITFYVNNPQNATNEVSAFAQATELYIDSEGTTFAGQGWYSNGSQAREWNGTAFIGGVFCGI